MIFFLKKKNETGWETYMQYKHENLSSTPKIYVKTSCDRCYNVAQNWDGEAEMGGSQKLG